VLGLPAADEFTAQRRRQQELAAALKQITEQVQQREHWKRQADGAQTSRAEFERRALVESEVNDYRTELVQQIRTSGSQLRRLSVSQAVRRPWHDDSHPLVIEKAPRGHKADAEAEYQLHSQTVSLSVSGSVDAVRGLLGKMQQTGTLKHTNQLSIRPAGNDRQQVEMEMEFILYGLEKAPKTQV
jgi:hypothetical protein